MHFLVICLICAIAAMVIGMVWYSKFVFGKTWSELSGVDKDDKSGCFLIMIYSMLANMALAVTLYSVALWSNAYGLKSGFFMGVLIGFGIVMISMMMPYIWEKKSPRLFLINAGHQVAVVVVMSSIITTMLEWGL
jgi:hypothetical protein